MNDQNNNQDGAQKQQSEWNDRELGALWKRESMQKGSNQKEWDMWMKHQDDHDYHAPLGEQSKWLGDAGFKNVECVWRHLLWSVLISIR